MFKIRCSSCQGLNKVAPKRLTENPTCGRCKTQLPLDQVIEVDDAGLASLIADSPLPLLVDFYADWCGPCRSLAPILQRVAKKHANQALVVKVNIDRNKQKAAELGVQGIPAVHSFKNGKHTGQQVGLARPPAYEALLAR